MKSLLKRLRLQSDLLPKFLAWAVPACPFFLEPVLVTAYTALFWAVAAGPRRAVQANLRALHPEMSAIGQRWGSFRVFLNFAWTCVDAERARNGAAGFHWQVDGAERFDAAAELDSGLLLLTAHMGNYDVAAAAFADRFGKKVHAVRAPEPTAELQNFRQSELARNAGDSLSIAYNTKEGLLGIDLIRALSDGEVVAIQGDRVMFDVSPTSCPFGESVRLRVPVGPFVLAMTARVPILPLFVIRVGMRRYRIVCGEMFHCVRTSRDKQADLDRAVTHWGKVLQGIVRPHWDQWFVFEFAFTAKHP
jgi:lauroyl/myristoyl acyltransferase